MSNIEINTTLEQVKTSLDNLTDEAKKKRLMKEYNLLYREFNFPNLRTAPNYPKILEDLIKLRNKINMPHPTSRKSVIENEEKKEEGQHLQFGGGPFLPQQNQEQEPIKITPATPEQKEALLYTGEVHEDDIDKYGIIGDYVKNDYYKNWWVKEGEKYKDILFEVAEYEASYYNYYNNTYTSKQLAKSYNKIAESFIIQNCATHCDGKIIIDYLKFIQQNPKFALPTLLWIDTFHDFKEERLDITVDKKKKKNLNDIIDYLCYRIYNEQHWGGLTSYTDNGKVKYNTHTDECVDIGHHYNFDKMYQNSFFTFDTNGVTGFQEDAKHTVLRPLVIDINENFINNQGIAKLLYKVSNVFINTPGGWESPFLYAYLMYNFNFDMNKNGLIQNLRDVFWNEIKADKKEEDYSIPYYAKDVDKGSSNFFKGTNIILPASLFDANRSNSSQNIDDFVPIETTVIPLCNGYEFMYNYIPTNCNLTLSYNSVIGGVTQSHILCYSNTLSNNSSCINPKNKRDYPNNIGGFIDELSTFKNNQKQTLNGLDENIKTLSRLITADNLYTNNIPNDIDIALTSVLTSVSNAYFDMNNCVNIPNGQGMSPTDVVTVVIGLLIDIKLNDSRSIYKNTQNGVFHPLSPISCKYLDFWVALKRIGDFGQIMQCKQLGIPLFTNDNMQLLISIAACSSAVWTEDNAKVLWYDSNKDAILCNGLNPDNRTICHKSRLILQGSVESYSIQQVLQFLKELPTEDTYTKLLSNWASLKKITGISVSDYLTNFYDDIHNNINLAINSSGQNNHLKKYIYYKIQEQILIHINYMMYNVNNTKFLNKLVQYQAQLQGQLQGQNQQLQIELQQLQGQNQQLQIELQQLQPQNQQLKIELKQLQPQNQQLKFELKQLQAQLKVYLQQLQGQLKVYLQQLQFNLQAQYNELQVNLQQGQYQPLNYIVNNQLKFELSLGPSNFIPYDKRKLMLQAASSSIENDYVEKLADLNDIRNGCVINRTS